MGKNRETVHRKTTMPNMYWKWIISNPKSSKHKRQRGCQILMILCIQCIHVSIIYPDKKEFWNLYSKWFQVSLKSGFKMCNLNNQHWGRYPDSLISQVFPAVVFFLARLSHFGCSYGITLWVHHWEALTDDDWLKHQKQKEQALEDNLGVSLLMGTKLASS